MPTVEELREAQWIRKNEELAEKARLKEKVLCAEITLPKSEQKDLGITGFTMKATEVVDWIERELDCGDKKSIKLTIKFSMRTNKWIESIPEADI